MSQQSFKLCLGTVLALCLPMGAHAVVTINMNQVGAHVVAIGSGTVNTAALTFDTIGIGATLWPVFLGGSFLTIGTAGSSSAAWQTALSGPVSFGTAATQTAANESTGDRIGIFSISRVYLPLDYVSGAPLAGTATWNNQTFESLGVTPGAYTWTWGSGATADSLVLNIGTAPIPEPGSLALLLAGLVCVGARVCRQGAGT